MEVLHVKRLDQDEERQLFEAVQLLLQIALRAERDEEARAYCMAAVDCIKCLCELGHKEGENP